MELTQQQVKTGINRWRKILQIESKWHIKFLIRKSSNEMSEGNEDAMACISVDLRYFIAEIEFNAPEIEEQDLEGVILHELLHILIEPLSCAAGCGLGRKFEEMNSILCESTIERLMPGYLYLYDMTYYTHSPKKRPATKTVANRKMKCKRKF